MWLLVPRSYSIKGKWDGDGKGRRESSFFLLKMIKPCMVNVKKNKSWNNKTIHIFFLYLSFHFSIFQQNKFLVYAYFKSTPISMTVNSITEKITYIQTILFILMQSSFFYLFFKCLCWTSRTVHNPFIFNKKKSVIARG